jgi:signal transduction histidine kinase
LWHQNWVTNRGQLLTIDGQRKDGEMILAGANADGLETSVRATWKLLESGDVRETAVRSSDAGRTWKPWFDLLFRALALTMQRRFLASTNSFRLRSRRTMIATIDKILSDESGADAGPLREQINLANLLQEIAVNGNFEARARSCSVFVGPVEACITTGVVDQVRRAIENVVQNVIRYARANSQVEIRMCKRGLLPEATGLIQVRDYGPGVPQADLEKIFLPFYRVHSENDSDPGGSGLGLAITERIIRMHGGNVRATNAAEVGLLVELELPLIA